MSAAQVLNGLALGALLTLLASGLALIYGLRHVMNFGHGGNYMLAAYLGTSVSAVAGFWTALVVVPVAMFGLGVALEFAVLRPLAGRGPIELAIVLTGIAWMLQNVIVAVYGPQARVMATPAPLDGVVQIGEEPYPAYRLLLIGFGIGSVLLIAAWLRFTRSGLHVRAVSARPDTARMAGVDTGRLGLLVVCLSTAFAGLAGVLAGPYLAVNPGMGDAILITSLIVVVLGGIGSIAGAVVAAVVIGFVQVLGDLVVPSVAALVPYLLLVVVLVLRPRGLMGRVIV
ncbi:branched-chain amino acid ABC transporter permease [Pseudonocardia ailaonensis]|uniref:Branched-chain amino acid ABC transporter permease n=1 Tax=Pseudonocardia ailaonensis TaxID=367279 RepID=A0ABN2NC76_9PSEU